ncbi:hypothetical protein LCGC14_1703660, partial [marine sediment metagenome]
MSTSACSFSPRVLAFRLAWNCLLDRFLSSPDDDRSAPLPLFQPDAFYEALSLVFTFKTMMWIAVGVTIGVGIGAVPGLSAVTGVALMLPLTFTMDTAPALGLLIGLYKGAVYGGSISAISFAIPGTPEAAATVYDGFKMMKAGKGRKALLIALYA